MARRLTQLMCLLLVLWLFRATEFDGNNSVPSEVNLLFRLDPLIAAATMLAAPTFLWVFWPCLVVMALTLLLGRLFCGWLCPLGTLLDIFHLLARRLIKRLRFYEATPLQRLRFVPLGLLMVILIAAAFGFQLVGYFDPFSILIRGLTTAVDPALSGAVTAPFVYLYRHGPSWITVISEPLYTWLKNHFLALEIKHYKLAGISFLLLAAVFILELLDRRFWCRYLCPLGGLLGFLARFSFLHRTYGKACNRCLACVNYCRMGALTKGNRFLPQACNLCLDCLEDCPRETVAFQFQRQPVTVPTVDFSKRAFLTAMTTGMALTAAFYMTGRNLVKRSVLRPPGAQQEPDFLNLCVRCGECLKVCPTAALQPSLLEGGINGDGIFAPRLIPRIGYCEYNCNLCGQVCPTGAIELLSIERKRRTVIGIAHFDTKRCLPYTKGETCLVCEEHCPTPEKAICFDEVDVFNARGERVRVRQPYVKRSLCIGCGICETKCPIKGESAIRVEPV